ncbi:MAG: sigma-70 family RNA polymerase sigma factor [Candidatus Roizmanbacteria bacterium]|nr:sigma-70 family RNA polymerase sigma factor [Candidatus Roizmanbacteria bacterium]
MEQGKGQGMEHGKKRPFISTAASREADAYNHVLFEQLRDLYSCEDQNVAVGYLMSADVAVTRGSPIESARSHQSVQLVPFMKWVQDYVKKNAPAYWVDDITATVFLKITNAIDNKKHPTINLMGWVSRTAKFACLDVLRKEASIKRWRGTVIDSDTFDIDQILSSSADIDPMLDTLDALYNSELLRKYLSKLKDLPRRMIVLYYIDGLSLDEIAALEETNVPAIKARLYRAKETMKSIVTLEEKADFLY